MYLQAIFLILLLNYNFSFSQDQKKDESLKNTIVIKIDPAYKNICLHESINNTAIQNIFDAIKTTKIEKMFPNAILPLKGNFFQTDITTIYKIEYSSGLEPEKVSAWIRKINIIMYAHPYYVPHVLSYIPDDPLNVNQYYLDNIKAYDAWGLVGGKGDSSIVIGITDTGIDLTHEDLIDNINYNFEDTIDGIDNDNDGYIDNFFGWDVANWDNSPQVETSPSINVYTRNHGIWVAGMAAARTDNGIGVSGTGFRSKFLPIKILNSDGIINSGYEGIVYAADHGCAIINCSWGGSTGHPFGQDIVNYATFNRNCLVIAAAGNKHEYDILYPAAYNNVLSVTGTNSADISTHSYNIHVDISAPGQNIFSPDINNTYWSAFSGTSYSSPIVAGCAAIVKSFFPNYRPQQIAERLRATSDNIDSINPEHAYLIGKGRANLYRALADSTAHSVRFENIEIEQAYDGIIPGEELEIKGIFINYLDSVSNLTVTITTDNPYLEIMTAENTLSLMKELDTIDNYTSPFIIKILDNVPYDEKIILKMNYSSSEIGYSDYQFIELDANLSYRNIDTNNISTTLTSIGRIGYNYSLSQGEGFRYKDGESILYEAGIMIASSNEISSVSVRDEYNFKINSAVKEISINATTHEPDIALQSVFSEQIDQNNFNVDVINRAFAWKKPGHENYIIVEYDVINKNAFPISNFYFGIFADWDIVNPFNNKTSYNLEKRLSYSYYNDGGYELYAGISHLSDLQGFKYSIDNVAGGNGGIDISDNYSKEEKYISLSNNRYEAGINGNDVVDVISFGPSYIGSGDTITYAFAMMAGETLYTLLQTAESAKQMYDSIKTSVNHQENTASFDFNIMQNDGRIKIAITGNESDFTVSIYNSYGQELLKAGAIGKMAEFSSKEYSSGVYIVEVYNGKQKLRKKFVLLHTSN
jgi:serine protease